MAKKSRTKSQKLPLSIRIDPKHVELAKWIAEQKSISYHSLMRMWIVEGIERDINILSKRRTDTGQRAKRMGKKAEKS